jgi:hypothetical protein
MKLNINGKKGDFPDRARIINGPDQGSLLRNFSRNGRPGKDTKVIFRVMPAAAEPVKGTVHLLTVNVNGLDRAMQDGKLAFNGRATIVKIDRSSISAEKPESLEVEFFYSPHLREGVQSFKESKKAKKPVT